MQRLDFGQCSRSCEVEDGRICTCGRVASVGKQLQDHRYVHNRLRLIHTRLLPPNRDSRLQDALAESEISRDVSNSDGLAGHI